MDKKQKVKLFISKIKQYYIENIAGIKIDDYQY
jgi:hypothetical protein